MKQLEKLTLNIYKSGHLVLCRLHFTPECRIGDPEQNRAEQSHAGPYWLPSCPAVQHTFNSVAAAALSCLVCAYVYVRVLRLFLCVRLPCTGSV